jgi:plastocyanin
MPDRLLKKSASSVLTSLGASTYPRGYASAPRSLRPCCTAFLNSLFQITPLFLGLSVVACDGRMQTVSLTAEDFRFTPELVRISSTSPLTLTIYNAGREVHEFDSPILIYAAKTPSSDRVMKPTGPGIVLEPGKSIQLAMAPPPGTYIYICRRKGHANMTGTLIVE